MVSRECRTFLIIILCKHQEDRFYDDLGDDEDGEVSELDRKGRFMQAYNVALSTDTQGYCVSSGSKIDRTPQELTAVSWAAFCTNVSSESSQ